MTKEEYSRVCTGFAMAKTEGINFTQMLVSIRDALRTQADAIDDFLKNGPPAIPFKQTTRRLPTFHMDSWYEQMLKEKNQAWEKEK